MESKSACTKVEKATKPQRTKIRSKSDELFENQFKDAPRKIFMRPPCEEEHEDEDPVDKIIQNCDHTVYILKDRHYVDLITRQLVSLDLVIQLQGDENLRVELIHSFTNVLQSLLSKFDDNVSEAAGIYGERMESLLKIAGRKIESPSLTAFHNCAADLHKLYDTIGLILQTTGKIFCRTIISITGDIIRGIACNKLAGSETDFTVSAYKAVVDCSLVPSIVQFFPQCFDDRDLAASILELLDVFQKYFPETIPVMLEFNLVELVCDLLRLILSDPCELTGHRHMAFLASGLLLKIIALEGNPDVIREEVQEAFASEKVIRAVHKACRRYCATVHETDRQIRNTFATILIFMIKMADTRLNLAFNLVEFGVIDWCLQAGTRPELNNQAQEIKNLRIQMHAHDVTFKQVLLRASMFTVAIQSPTVPLPENLILASLLYYFAPYQDHPRHFWTPVDYDSHRVVVLEVLSACVCYMRSAWKELNGNEELVTLLKRIIGTDPAFFSPLPPSSDFERFRMQTLVNTIRVIQCLLMNGQTTLECCLEFCVDKAGVDCLFSTLEFVMENGETISSQVQMVIYRDILYSLNHVSQKYKTIQNRVQFIGSAVLLRLLKGVRLNFERVEDCDVARCLFSAVAIWIIGKKGREVQFLETHGPERLIEILTDSPLPVKNDVIPALEEILRKSFRVTKYLEYSSSAQFLKLLVKLWNQNVHHNLLHAVLKTLRDSWDSTADNFGDFNMDLLTVIDNYVVDEMEQILTNYLRANLGSKNVMEEIRKMVLVLRAGGPNCLTEPLRTAVEGLGNYSGCLEEIAAKSYQTVTGNDPYAKLLYAEGNDEKPQKIFVARSDTLFPSDSSCNLNIGSGADC